MKKHSQLLIVTIGAAMAYGAIFAVWHAGPVEAAAGKTGSIVSPSSSVSTKGGSTVVTLDKVTQKFSGIQTQPLVAAKEQADRLAYGSVIDIQPLIDLYARYRSAMADVAAAQAAADVSKQEAKRNTTLYQNDSAVALKTMQATQATWSVDKAKLEAAKANLKVALASTQHQFGAQLAQGLADSSTLFLRLLNGKDMLMRIVLPLGSDPQAPSQITIDDGTHERITATFVSQSPQSSPTVMGSAYLYAAPANLPVGSNLVAHLPSSNPAQSGVIVPSDAVLWFGGQPWAYVLQGQTHFVRRPVFEKSRYANGFFVSGGFKPGDRVVTQGAELLLSEEQRPPVTSVAACKDPECDD